MSWIRKTWGELPWLLVAVLLVAIGIVTALLNGYLSAESGSETDLPGTVGTASSTNESDVPASLNRDVGGQSMASAPPSVPETLTAATAATIAGEAEPDQVRAAGSWDKTTTVIQSDGFTEAEVGTTVRRTWVIRYDCEVGLCDGTLDSVDQDTGETLGSGIPLVVDRDGVHHLYAIAGHEVVYDCVDLETGDVRVPEGYRGVQRHTFWVSRVSEDGQSIALEGRAEIEASASASSVAAGCQELITATYLDEGIRAGEGP